jgi:hypothetical protein
MIQKFVTLCSMLRTNFWIWNHTREIKVLVSLCLRTILRQTRFPLLPIVL